MGVRFGDSAREMLKLRLRPVMSSWHNGSRNKRHAKHSPAANLYMQIGPNYGSHLIRFGCVKIDPDKE